jgi:hypothetical protein
MDITPVVLGTATCAVNWNEWADFNPLELPPQLTNPNPRVIQTDQRMHVHFSIAQNGVGWGIVGASTWHCEVIFEQMGPGEGPGSVFADTPFVAAAVHTYPTVHVDIPPNTLAPGIYRMIATMTLINNGNAQCPVVGFEDLGIIRIAPET